ncbi:MAG: flavin-nucleotide-binding protein [Shinella sp.]|nr:MAG: flavin-nucleotide-binding protein [Shinella sp.]
MTNEQTSGPRINQAIRTDIDNSVLCWLATVDEDGVRNIRTHPKVCVSFVDVFRQRGFKIVGTAYVLVPEENDFTALGQDLLRMAGKDFPIRNIIAVRIERVSRIWAPSYNLFPDRSEAERMQAAYDTYRVRPLD